MAAKGKSEPKTFEILGEQPVILSGQPGVLRGDLVVRYQGVERIRLRELALTSKNLDQVYVKTRRTSAGPVMRLRPGVIRPGHTGPVSLSIDLDAQTPPGEYQAKVDIAGTAQPVVIHVLEKVALRIQPAQLVIENLPDQKVTKQIVVRNLGNVPLTIGEIGAVYLDDDLQVCRTLRAAAASVDDELRPLEEYLARILLEAKHVAESSGILRIHNLEGRVVVQPGETRPMNLEIRVPGGLDRRGRYRGVAAIYTTNLSFVIVPTTGPTVPEVDVARRKA
jgi:hypothetical protein